MTLKELREKFYSASKKLSDINRQFAFAGLGLIWVLKEEAGTASILSSGTETAAFLIVLSLALDFFHYVYRSALFSFLHWWKEGKGVKEGKNIGFKKIYNWPTIIFFWGKVLTLSYAYILLLKFIAAKYPPSIF